MMYTGSFIVVSWQLSLEAFFWKAKNAFRMDVRRHLIRQTPVTAGKHGNFHLDAFR